MSAVIIYMQLITVWVYFCIFVIYVANKAYLLTTKQNIRTVAPPGGLVTTKAKTRIHE